ncbi:MAG: hypothetical protein AAFR81_07840 [Chloroflexota bacterium]
MPVWWDEHHKQIARLHVPTIVLWQEYDTLIDKLVCMLSTVSYPVDIISTRETEHRKPGGTPHLQRAIKLILDIPHVNRIVTIQPEGTTFANVVFRSSIRIQDDDIQEKFLFATSLSSAYNLLSDE